MEPTKVRNLDRYGTPPLAWEPVAGELFEAVSQAPDTGGPNRFTYWLATTNADGTPHVAAVGVLPIDGVLCVVSGLGTRKSRNLGRNPRCVLTVSTHRFDLAVEGSARMVPIRSGSSACSGVRRSGFLLRDPVLNAPRGKVGRGVCWRPPSQRLARPRRSPPEPLLSDTSERAMRPLESSRSLT